jgi:hypothetical protein
MLTVNQTVISCDVAIVIQVRECIEVGSSLIFKSCYLVDKL